MERIFDEFRMPDSFTWNGIKCENCGKIWVHDSTNNADWLCVCLKVDNISQWRNFDKPIDVKTSIYLLKQFGFDFSGGFVPRVLWPATFANGRISEELSRSDVDVSYQQVYDTTRNNGGGHIILSPLVSKLFMCGMLVKQN
ncbi:MAG: hypothetical protein MRERV_49c005 [Mycoplasmataceae bacterium RV_VA103A]|nr:MAG: hypothetical protein MRERV_49c005 [Mycoplasmataceae bacterium RV_VA103A]